MFLQTLSTKLSQSLDVLGRLLDLIHRLSHHQRKQYFEKIQAFKNQLLSLKTNLRQSNALQTERKYNTIHVAVTSLATQVDEEINLVANKENRHPNQVGFIRQSKKSHDEALRLIAEKDEEISQLKQLLFEKEELIRLNYEQLRNYQRDCNLLAHENHTMSNQISRLQREIQEFNHQLEEAVTQLTELRILSQDQERQLRIKDECFAKTTDELIIAKKRILSLQELAEVSVSKALLVEENIRRVEDQAAFLNFNYKQREEQSIQRQKDIEMLRYQVRVKQKRLTQLQLQNRGLNDKVQTLECQIAQLQQSIEAYETEQKEAQCDFEQDLNHWKETTRDLELKYNQKVAELEQSQTKFIELYKRLQQKLDQIDSLRAQIQTLLDKQQGQLEAIAKLQAQKDQNQKQNVILSQQKNILAEQLQKSISNNQQYEQTLASLRDKARTQQSQIGSLSQTVRQLQQQVQVHQINSRQNQTTHNQFRKIIQEYEQRVLKMHNQASAQEKIQAQLKKRLLKAKIEVVHQIRSSLQQ